MYPTRTAVQKTDRTVIRAENCVVSTYSLYSMRCLKSGVIGASLRALASEHPHDGGAQEAITQNNCQKGREGRIRELSSHDGQGSYLDRAGQNRGCGEDENAGHEWGQRETQTQNSDQIPHHRLRQCAHSKECPTQCILEQASACSRKQGSRGPSGDGVVYDD